MSTTVRPATPKGRATRDRLLDAARREALATGGRIEIARVAEAAGVVPSLVHRYFGSKAGLVCALVDAFFDRLDAEVLDVAPEALGAGGWARRERARLERGVRFHYDEPFAVVLYAQLAREPEVARTEAARSAAVVEGAARNIRRGQRRGELPAGTDPRLAGAAMFGAMRLVMVEALTRARRPPIDEVIDVMWRQVAASVGIDPRDARTEDA